MMVIAALVGVSMKILTIIKRVTNWKVLLLSFDFWYSPSVWHQLDTAAARWYFRWKTKQKERSDRFSRALHNVQFKLFLTIPTRIFSTVLSTVHKLKPGSAAYWPCWLYYDVPSYWPHSRHSTLLIPAAAPTLPRTRELSTQNVELDTEAEGLPPSIILFRGQFTSLQFIVECFPHHHCTLSFKLYFILPVYSSPAS